MSATGVSEHPERVVRLRRTAVVCLLFAAGLFLCSAALQFAASIQRWVVFSNTLDPTKMSAEDHIYDYYFIWHDWVPIGTAAEQFGWGLLLQVAGILLMALAVLFLTGRAEGSSAAAAAAMVAVEVLVVLVVIGMFALLGAHALLSSRTGTASPLLQWFSVQWLSTVGLAFLAIRWVRIRPSAAVACLCLIGSTMIGYFICTYLIAPVFAGESHDTARWTEAVVAASTAAAGIALIVGAAKVARSRVAAPAATCGVAVASTARIPSGSRRHP